MLASYPPPAPPITSMVLLVLFHVASTVQAVSAVLVRKTIGAELARHLHPAECRVDTGSGPREAGIGIEREIGRDPSKAGSRRETRPRSRDVLDLLRELQRQSGLNS